MIWNTDRMDYFAADFFQGMGLAMPDRWEPLIGVRNAGAIVRKGFDPTRFAIIISGGGGNGPLFPGYVGEGLADAAVIGAPFAAPNAYTIYETGKALRPEKGVLLLYNNFAGDFLNNDMAAEFLQMDGIPVESVISNDDIASAVGEERSARGGRCGIAFLMKMAANCAKRDMSLQDTAALLRAAQNRLGTLSIHLDFGSRLIAYGAGFSGESGVRTATHMDMGRCAQEACNMLLEDLEPQAGERLYVLVNRLRYTSYADGYIFANLVHRYLAAQYPVEQMRVANFSNIIDIYGYSVTILCADANLRPYLEGTCYTDSFIL